MSVSEITFGDFAPEHLDGAWALSHQAGWPHRPEDWALGLSLSAGIVALARGRVVGASLFTPYGRDAATINMVIVDQNMRGRGVGRTLMERMLQIGDGRECRLVATPEGLPLYEKLGFSATETILQHQGVAAPNPQPDGVEPASLADMETMAAMDRIACGMDRRALFARIAGTGRFAVLRRRGECVGFAAHRDFGRGQVIGPAVAGHGDDAKALISFFLAERPGAFVRVDTPAAGELAPWLARRGLFHAGLGLAMSRGGQTYEAPSPMRTFALASQALG